MKPIRQRKLFFILSLLVVLTITTLLITYALRQNISLFYSPSQIANHEAPENQSIRIGGMVMPGSIQRNASDLTVKFAITDYQSTVQVVYTGVLPDLFAEGKGVVAQGVYQALTKEFKAREILAKHDENYMPPQVKAILNEKKS